MANEDEPQAPPSASYCPSDNEEDSSSGSSPPFSSDSDTDTTFRKQIGSHLSTLTDVVNDNLIIVRYATFSTVFLLGAYGVANTPLFYRYKNLNDIASKVFTKRQRIHGRIVGVLDSTNNNVAGSGRQFVSSSSQSSKHWNDVAASSSSTLNNSDDNSTQPQQQRPITILFRHSSPMERLLTQSAMDKILQFTSSSGKSSSPSGLLYSSSNTHRNLLPIELAGVVSPPTIATTNHHSASSVLSATLTNGASSTSTSAPSPQVPEVLQSLIEKKARISLQMLALRTSSTNGTDQSTSSSMMDENNMHSAICHLNYRKPNQWFSTTKLGLELVQRGQALVNQDGLVIPTKDDNNAALIDFNPTVKQLQTDSTFISLLEEAEFAAWKSKEGVWSSSQMRELRKEYVEEEEHLNSSLWSRVKRGFSWIIGVSRK
ncbi:hypothetical protein QTG54_003715 [Skeletonema marinoi]|uniref:Uncharacterized protein n=1 Tax=Skeletonema marinoi TaxID=267567 RepID=A0AAD8YG00_9STRA|nr:hypothetical protein QTG54_003715 [Skeletonema marinoi]